MLMNKNWRDMYKQKKTNPYYIVYIASTIRSESNQWLWNIAKSLNDYAPTMYLDPADMEPIPFKTLMSINTIKLLSQRIKKVWDGTLVEWQLVDVLPFKRYTLVQNLNIHFNSWLIQWLIGLRHGHLVLIQNGAISDRLQVFCQTLRSDIFCEDCVDMTDSKGIREATIRADVVFTNSVPLTRWCQQFNTHVHQISAGYFYPETIQLLATHSYHRDPRTPKRVLLMGNASDRWDFPLLEYLVTTLTSYEFIFITSGEFDRTVNDEYYDSYRRHWQKILAYPNVIHQKVMNQKGYRSSMFDADIAIIPYDMQFEFNTYCHPVKIYNYLLAGIPVVSPFVQSIKKFISQHCQFANTNENFLRLIQKLSDVKIDLKSKSKYQKLAMQHTYNRKALQIIDLLDKNI